MGVDLLTLPNLKSAPPSTIPQSKGSGLQAGKYKGFIRLPGNEIYIDRFGWIRQGNIYGKANALEIEEKLSTPCADK